MGTKIKFGVWGLAAFFVLGSCAFAVSPLRGVTHAREVQEVESRDHVKTYLFHYEPVATALRKQAHILLEPGYTQTPASIETVVRDFLRVGAFPSVGQVREAGREYQSGSGRYNGNQEVYFNDVAEHIVQTFVRSRGEPISLWGNSNGGNALLAILSNEKVRRDIVRRAQALTPPDSPIHQTSDLDGSVIRSVDVVGAPGDFKDLHKKYPKLVAFAKKNLPLIVGALDKIPASKKTGAAPGSGSIDVLHRVLNATARWKRSGWRNQASAYLVEKLVLSPIVMAARFGFADMKNVPKNLQRRLFKKGISAIPKESGLEFLQAVVRGQMRGRGGGRYENPEIMADFDDKPLLRVEAFPRDVPVRVISPTEDVFCPLSQQRDLFERLGSVYKSWVKVPGKGHVFFLEDQLADINSPSLEFFLDPRGTVEREHQVKFSFSGSSCERVLMTQEDEWNELDFDGSVLELRPWKWFPRKP